MSPERLSLERFLTASWRRLAVQRILWCSAAAAIAAAMLQGLSWALSLSWTLAVVAGAACVAVGAIAGGMWAVRRRERIAHDVEERASRCHNILVTAAELSEPTNGTAKHAVVRADVIRLVEAHAASLVASLDPRSLFPLQRPVAAFAAMLLLWGGLAYATPEPRAGRAGGGDVPALGADVTPEVAAIEVTVTPPEYTGAPAVVATDPQRIDAIAGSRIEIVARAAADRVTLSTLDGGRDLEPSGDGRFEAQLLAEADGFLALEPHIGERVGLRRLMGLSVTPDAPPLVRITEPGQDLFLPEPDGGIPIVAVAEDDFAVDDLRIAYTIVSGSGENFEFSEGELAAELQRDDNLSWGATASLDPAALGLDLGDIVVYRAVARDRRPGAPEVSSDSFVVEIVGENAAISGGFALESDEEREALSQRMIIIKTERLLAQKDSMSAEDYLAEARRLAAEQRIVRAEFVFMMGGEVQDEVEEAEHSHEVAEGRLQLRGRQEMSRSVLYMSQAAQMLTDTNLEAALPLEYAALEALQSALARSRYILRTMIDRQSIDLSRRLSGEAGLDTGSRAAVVGDEDLGLDALRAVLADVAALSNAAADDERSRRIAGVAEDLVRVDPTSTEFQELALQLSAAAQGDAGGAEALGAVLDSLRAIVNARVPGAPAAPRQDADLAGAFNDARGGGR